MIRMVADKLGRRTSPKPAHTGSKQPAGPGQHSPSASLSSVHSVATSAPSYDHRPSLSTERTSISAWSKQQEAMDVDPTPRFPLRTRTTTGYRLLDFQILRTLGTGSFGRVHLGKSSLRLTMYV